LGCPMPQKRCLRKGGGRCSCSQPSVSPAHPTGFQFSSARAGGGWSTELAHPAAFLAPGGWASPPPASKRVTKKGPGQDLLAARPGSLALVVSTENITQNLYQGNERGPGPRRLQRPQRLDLWRLGALHAASNDSWGVLDDHMFTAWAGKSR